MDNIIYLIIVGAVAGFLASLVIPNKFGFIGTIIVGIIGGVLGGLLLNDVNILSDALISSILKSFIGAVVLLFIIRLIKKA